MKSSRRALVIPFLIGAAAAICLFGYDAISTIRCQGGRYVWLTIQAPRPVRTVVYADGSDDFAEHYRAQPPEYWDFMLRADASPELVSHGPDGRLKLHVRTFGRQSGLRIIQDQRGQMTQAVVLVELEPGEHWVAILKLPDVTKSNAVTLRIPENAHWIGFEVAPAPRPSVAK